MAFEGWGTATLSGTLGQQWETTTGHRPSDLGGGEDGTVVRERSSEKMGMQDFWEMPQRKWSITLTCLTEVVFFDFPWYRDCIWYLCRVAWLTLLKWNWFHRRVLVRMIDALSGIFWTISLGYGTNYPSTSTSFQLFHFRFFQEYLTDLPSRHPKVFACFSDQNHCGVSSKIGRVRSSKLSSDLSIRTILKYSYSQDTDSGAS